MTEEEKLETTDRCTQYFCKATLELFILLEFPSNIPHGFNSAVLQIEKLQNFTLLLLQPVNQFPQIGAESCWPSHASKVVVLMVAFTAVICSLRL